MGAVAWWKYTGLFESPSREVVQLDAHKRDMLTRLRNEEKFEPHQYPPLDYTGIATPEDGRVARAAVNEVLDAVLARRDGPIGVMTISGLIGRGMKRVDLLGTEDRDRTGDYMIEI